MNIDEFSLAATTNDLAREPEARDVADCIEFRMDTAENAITQLSEYDGELPIIATNRTKWFGGKANDSGRLDHLFAASRFDAVDMVDIEVEATRGKQWILSNFRENDVKIITSFHGFENTPDQETLDAIIEDCANYGEVAKVATFAENRSDTLTMLKSIHSATKKGTRVAGLSMGKLGAHTRVIGPTYGSKLGYAPLESDSIEYAPGQISLCELRSLIERVGEASKRISIAGEQNEQATPPLSIQTD